MHAHWSALKERVLVRRASEEISNLTSLLAFFGVTTLLFRSVEFAMIVTTSLGIHELGHAALLAKKGLPWRISFGLVGASTWSPAVERKKLTNFANSTIHLAGPVFSLLLALTALGAARLFPYDQERLSILANFSAQVGLLNLLPLGAFTDGGKVIRRVLAPLGCAARTWAALPPLFLAVLMLVAYKAGVRVDSTSGQPGAVWIGLLLMAAWMTGSLLLEAGKDQPENHLPEQPTTPAQGILLLLFLWVMLVLAALISANTPFWLAPRYLLGSLENVMAVIRLLTGGLH